MKLKKKKNVFIFRIIVTNIYREFWIVLKLPKKFCDYVLDFSVSDVKSKLSLF